VYCVRLFVFRLTLTKLCSTTG